MTNSPCPFPFGRELSLLPDRYIAVLGGKYEILTGRTEQEPIACL